MTKSVNAKSGVLLVENAGHISVSRVPSVNANCLVCPVILCSNPGFALLQLCDLMRAI